MSARDPLTCVPTARLGQPRAGRFVRMASPSRGDAAAARAGRPRRIARLAGDPAPSPTQPARSPRPATPHPRGWAGSRQPAQGCPRPPGFTIWVAGMQIHPLSYPDHENPPARARDGATRAPHLRPKAVPGARAGGIARSAGGCRCAGRGAGARGWCRCAGRGARARAGAGGRVAALTAVGQPFFPNAPLRGAGGRNMITRFGRCSRPGAVRSVAWVRHRALPVIAPDCNPRAAGKERWSRVRAASGRGR